MSKRINNRFNHKNKCEITVFKSSDYDLDKDERKVKYKDKAVLCEKCKGEINRDWHCRKCYNNETGEEKYHMLHGKCKGCFQVLKIRGWCSPCNSKRLKQDFIKWTSGNDDIDKVIKDSQISAYSKNILEWIPYENFKDIKSIDKGGFAKVFSATWIDGRIDKWDHGSNKWKRSGSIEVALKVSLRDSKELSDDFLYELKSLKKFSSYYHTHVIECYGITREPGTHNYALVLKLKDGNLRSYLKRNYRSLTLKDKLEIIEHICLGLDSIHSHNIIHRDLHLGNILHSFKKKHDISISDFGFCRPVDEINTEQREQRIYGIMPYMAPEILRGKKYSQKSDIYSFGIIINEIIFGNPPFGTRLCDENLALDICRGLRPNIRDKTPEPLKKLIQKCWDATPENRPNVNQIYNMLRDFIYTKNENSYNFRNYTKQYEEFRELSSYNSQEQRQPEESLIEITIDSLSRSKNNFLFIPNHYNRTKSATYTIKTIKSECDECLECAIKINN